MARNIVFGIAVLLTLGPAVSVSRAQDSMLQEMYGQGVHAYFSGKYDQAHELFSRRLNREARILDVTTFVASPTPSWGGPMRPRRTSRRGGEFEAEGAAVQIDVGQALQRVQGPLRLQLEEHRYAARLAAHLRGGRKRRRNATKRCSATSRTCSAVRAPRPRALRPLKWSSRPLPMPPIRSPLAPELERHRLAAAPAAAEPATGRARAGCPCSAGRRRSFC